MTTTNLFEITQNNRWAILPEKLSALLEATYDASFYKRSDFEGTQYLYAVRNHTAIINIQNIIFPYSNWLTEYFEIETIESLTFKFTDALANPDVKSIIFYIDSPGGDITGVNEFADLIYNSRGIKPITAYCNGLCCSAAYWIASACDKIVTDITATIGSIGVVASWTDDSKALEKAGYKKYEIVSPQTPLKRIDLQSDEGINTIKSELQKLADIFIAVVARNRNQSIEHVRENFGQGGTMLANDSIAVGMTDAIGSLETILTNKNIKGGHTMDEFIKNAITDDEKDEEKDTKKSKKVVEPDDDEKKDENCEDDEEKDEDAKKKGASEWYQKGVLAERRRLQGIIDIANIQGYTEIITDAMFKNPLQAEQLAVKILSTEKINRDTLLQSLQQDANAIPHIPRSEPMETRKSVEATKPSDENQAAFIGGSK